MQPRARQYRAEYHVLVYGASTSSRRAATALIVPGIHVALGKVPAAVPVALVPASQTPATQPVRDSTHVLDIPLEIRRAIFY